MRSTFTQAMHIAAEQHGVVTRRQLSDIGLTPSTIKHLVRSGALRRMVDGAYRLASNDETELARCAAISLARPGLTVCGPTAARLWNLRRVGHDGIVHVLAKPHAQPARVPWVRTYRTARIADADVVRRTDGIRLTSVQRTVVDMIRYAPDAAIASMIEQGLDERRFTVGSLRTCAERIATPGRPFAHQFLAVLDQRIGGGAAGSDWETVVGAALRNRGIGDVERQFVLEVGGYGKLRFDLAIPSIRWALEVDVHPSHYSREGASRDKFRDRCCAEEGWLVQRVGEPDLRRRFDDTIASIERSITDRRRHMSLPKVPPAPDAA